MTSSLNQAARRMTLLWFVVLSGPLLIGLGTCFLVWVAGYSAPATLFPEETLRMAAMGAMALMLTISRPLRNVLLSPGAIAKRPLRDQRHANIEQQATAQTQASMFLLLGLLETVSMLIVALSLMQADAGLALLNGVYTLALGIVAKPDFARLITETLKTLRQAS